MTSSYENLPPTSDLVDDSDVMFMLGTSTQTALPDAYGSMAIESVGNVSVETDSPFSSAGRYIGSLTRPEDILSFDSGFGKIVLGTDGSAHIYNSTLSHETSVSPSDSTSGFGKKIVIAYDRIYVGADSSIFIYNLDGTGEQKISETGIGANFVVQSDRILAPVVGGNVSHIYHIDGSNKVSTSAFTNATSDYGAYGLGVCEASNGSYKFAYVGDPGYNGDRGAVLAINLEIYSSPYSTLITGEVSNQLGINIPDIRNSGSNWNGRIGSAGGYLPQGSRFGTVIACEDFAGVYGNSTGFVAISAPFANSMYDYDHGDDWDYDTQMPWGKTDATRLYKGCVFYFKTEAGYTNTNRDRIGFKTQSNQSNFVISSVGHVNKVSQISSHVDYHSFGESMAYRDGKLIVGAPYDGEAGARAGAVFVFDTEAETMDVSSRPATESEEYHLKYNPVRFVNKFVGDEFDNTTENYGLSVAVGGELMLSKGSDNNVYVHSTEGFFAKDWYGNYVPSDEKVVEADSGRSVGAVNDSEAGTAVSATDTKLFLSVPKHNETGGVHVFNFYKSLNVSEVITIPYAGSAYDPMDIDSDNDLVATVDSSGAITLTALSTGVVQTTINSGVSSPIEISIGSGRVALTNSSGLVKVYNTNGSFVKDLSDGNSGSDVKISIDGYIGTSSKTEGTAHIFDLDGTKSTTFTSVGGDDIKLTDSHIFIADSSANSIHQYNKDGSWGLVRTITNAEQDFGKSVDANSSYLVSVANSILFVYALSDGSLVSSTTVSPSSQVYSDNGVSQAEALASDYTTSTPVTLTASAGKIEIDILSAPVGEFSGPTGANVDPVDIGAGINGIPDISAVDSSYKDSNGDLLHNTHSFIGFDESVKINASDNITLDASTGSIVYSSLGAAYFDPKMEFGKVYKVTVDVERMDSTVEMKTCDVTGVTQGASSKLAIGPAGKTTGLITPPSADQTYLAIDNISAFDPNNVTATVNNDINTAYSISLRNSSHTHIGGGYVWEVTNINACERTVDGSGNWIPKLSEIVKKDTSGNVLLTIPNPTSAQALYTFNSWNNTTFKTESDYGLSLFGNKMKFWSGGFITECLNDGSYFDGGCLIAYDYDGNQLWKKRYGNGTASNVIGYGSNVYRHLCSHNIHDIDEETGIAVVSYATSVSQSSGYVSVYFAFAVIDLQTGNQLGNAIKSNILWYRFSYSNYENLVKFAKCADGHILISHGVRGYSAEPGTFEVFEWNSATNSATTIRRADNSYARRDLLPYVSTSASAEEKNRQDYMDPEMTNPYHIKYQYEYVQHASQFYGQSRAEWAISMGGGRIAVPVRNAYIYDNDHSTQTSVDKGRKMLLMTYDLDPANDVYFEHGDTTSAYIREPLGFVTKDGFFVNPTSGTSDFQPTKYSGGARMNHLSYIENTSGFLYTGKASSNTTYTVYDTETLTERDTFVFNPANNDTQLSSGSVDEFEQFFANRYILKSYDPTNGTCLFTNLSNVYEGRKANQAEFVTAPASDTGYSAITGSYAEPNVLVTITCPPPDDMASTIKSVSVQELPVSTSSSYAIDFANKEFSLEFDAKVDGGIDWANFDPSIPPPTLTLNWGVRHYTRSWYANFSTGVSKLYWVGDDGTKVQIRSYQTSSQYQPWQSYSEDLGALGISGTGYFAIGFTQPRNYNCDPQYDGFQLVNADGDIVYDYKPQNRGTFGAGLGFRQANSSTSRYSPGGGNSVDDIPTSWKTTNLAQGSSSGTFNYDAYGTPTYYSGPSGSLISGSNGYYIYFEPGYYPRYSSGGQYTFWFRTEGTVSSTDPTATSYVFPPEPHFLIGDDRENSSDPGWALSLEWKDNSQDEVVISYGSSDELRIPLGFHIFDANPSTHTFKLSRDSYDGDLVLSVDGSPVYTEPSRASGENSIDLHASRNLFLGGYDGELSNLSIEFPDGPRVNRTAIDLADSAFLVNADNGPYIHRTNDTSYYYDINGKIRHTLISQSKNPSSYYGMSEGNHTVMRESPDVASVYEPTANTPSPASTLAANGDDMGKVSILNADGELIKDVTQLSYASESGDYPSTYTSNSFGTSVSATDTTLMVGEPVGKNVYVYDGEGNPLTKLSSDTDNFGTSVASNGMAYVVGAPKFIEYGNTTVESIEVKSSTPSSAITEFSEDNGWQKYSNLPNPSYDWCDIAYGNGVVVAVSRLEDANYIPNVGDMVFSTTNLGALPGVDQGNNSYLVKEDINWDISNMIGGTSANLPYNWAPSTDADGNFDGRNNGWKDHFGWTGNTGHLAYSTDDGATWSTMTDPNSLGYDFVFNCIAFGKGGDIPNGKFVALCRGGNRIYTSEDGINWESNDKPRDGSPEMPYVNNYNRGTIYGTYNASGASLFNVMWDDIYWCPVREEFIAMGYAPYPSIDRDKYDATGFNHWYEYSYIYRKVSKDGITWSQMNVGGDGTVYSDGTRVSTVFMDASLNGQKVITGIPHYQGSSPDGYVLRHKNGSATISRWMDTSASYNRSIIADTLQHTSNKELFDFAYNYASVDLDKVMVAVGDDTILYSVTGSSWMHADFPLTPFSNGTARKSGVISGNESIGKFRTVTYANGYWYATCDPSTASNGTTTVSGKDAWSLDGKNWYYVSQNTHLNDIFRNVSFSEGKYVSIYDGYNGDFAITETPRTPIPVTTITLPDDLVHRQSDSTLLGGYTFTGFLSINDTISSLDSSASGQVFDISGDEIAVWNYSGDFSGQPLKLSEAVSVSSGAGGEVSVYNTDGTLRSTIVGASYENFGKFVGLCHDVVLITSKDRLFGYDLDGNQLYNLYFGDSKGNTKIRSFATSEDDTTIAIGLYGDLWRQVDSSSSYSNHEFDDANKLEQTSIGYVKLFKTYGSGISPTKVLRARYATEADYFGHDIAINDGKIAVLSPGREYGWGSENGAPKARITLFTIDGRFISSIGGKEWTKSSPLALDSPFGQDDKLALLGNSLVVTHPSNGNRTVYAESDYELPISTAGAPSIGFNPDSQNGAYMSTNNPKTFKVTVGPAQFVRDYYDDGIAIENRNVYYIDGVPTKHNRYTRTDNSYEWGYTSDANRTTLDLQFGTTHIFDLSDPSNLGHQFELQGMYSGFDRDWDSTTYPQLPYVFHGDWVKYGVDGTPGARLEYTVPTIAEGGTPGQPGAWTGGGYVYWKCALHDDAMGRGDFNFTTDAPQVEGSAFEFSDADDFTIEAQFKLENTSGYKYPKSMLLIGSNNEGDNYGFAAILESEFDEDAELHIPAKRLKFTNNGPSGLVSDCYATLPDNDNEWHHIVIMRSSGKLSIIYDGVEIYSKSDLLVYPQSGPIYIGGTPEGYLDFEGNIINMRISRIQRYDSTETYVSPKNVYVKINGEWKNVDDIFVKVNNEWKNVINDSLIPKVDGGWKKYDPDGSIITPQIVGAVKI